MLLVPVLLRRRAAVPHGGIFFSRGAVSEGGGTPVAVLLSPVRFRRRASNPVAVFSLPVVFRPRAWPPVAVLRLPVVLLSEGPGTPWRC